jgi:peptidoglycan hydrolase CwlO-like protein
MEINVKQAKADLKVRQEAVVKELNEVIAGQQALAQRRAELTEEALRLNGEARYLNDLSDNGSKGK